MVAREFKGRLDEIDEAIAEVEQSLGPEMREQRKLLGALRKSL